MTGLAWLAAAFVLGAAAGVAYFSALRATVQALPGARHPALVVLGSFLARLALAGVLFLLLVRHGGWPWIVSGLAGFVVARMIVVRAQLPADTPPPRESS